MNPILKGLYADPDIIKVNENYYIYPTTDGYTGWGSKVFYVFKSKDKKVWEKVNTVLDFEKGDVPWAKSNAWAPCMLHFNNKFYYYFCGKREDGISCIGVAESESPEGPFTAKTEPLITPEIVRGQGYSIGQTIDPAVYVEDNKAYLLFGNGNPFIVELTKDGLDIKLETMASIVGAHDFREAIEVFKRGGKYHFTWSCDDTGSENYHINYGVSDTLYGKIQFLYPILRKNPEKDILGTGHHSILVEDDDTYYIAYHRFGTPLEKYPTEKGFHREVCLDRLFFDEEGYIKEVEPTN